MPIRCGSSAAATPELCPCVSNGASLLAACRAFTPTLKRVRSQGAAQLVGQRIAELCLAKDISDVSFDRGGNVYHGRVKVRHLVQ